LKFFDAIKALFPRSRVFELFINNNKRKLMEVLSVLPEDIRHEAELVYMDLFPDTTRFPEEWEKVYSIFFTEDELSKRREILDSLWKINIYSGQSAPFMEQILQKIHKDIKIVENIPMGNPRDSNSIVVSVCNAKAMVCGNKMAVCGYRIGDPDFIPTILQNDVSSLYSIPNDPAFWELCFYVCGTVIRNKNNKILYVQKISIDVIWKNYIEFMILKIKPVHTTAVMFIEWV
jgi:hypothetical protein